MNIIIKIILMAILWFAAYSTSATGFKYHKTDDIIGGIALWVLLFFWIYRSVVPRKNKN